MEFKITTDLSNVPEKIEFNFEELKNEISERLTYYENLVVTEDKIKEAKSDKATLNKLIKAIDERRKEIKNQMLAPYADLESKCKEITALIQAPVIAIDTQLKAFDDKRIEDKYNEIKTAFKGFCTADYIDLEKIINPKWKNATVKTSTVIDELKTAVTSIMGDMQSLEMQYGTEPYFIAIKNTFCKRYVLADAIVYANDLEKQEKERQELFKRQEEQKRLAEESLKQAMESYKQPKSEPINQTEPKPNSVIYHGKFEVWGTREQIISMREYLKNSGIKFATIK